MQFKAEKEVIKKEIMNFSQFKHHEELMMKKENFKQRKLR